MIKPELKVLGRSVAEPRSIQTKTGVMASCVVACNWTYNGKEQTKFVEVLFFNKSAEIALKRIEKGSTVFAQGMPDIGVYNDKNTGEPKATLKLLTNNFYIVPSNTSTSNIDYVSSNEEIEMDELF